MRESRDDDVVRENSNSNIVPPIPQPVRRGLFSPLHPLSLYWKTYLTSTLWRGQGSDWRINLRSLARDGFESAASIVREEGGGVNGLFKKAMSNVSDKSGTNRIPET